MATVHFSDGFESNDFSAWTGTLIVGENNGIVTTSSKAKVGTYCAFVAIEDAVNADKAYCYKVPFGSIGSGSHLWASAWFWFPTGFDCEQGFNLLSVGEGEGAYKAFTIQMLDNEVLRIEDTINAASYTQASPIPITTNQWCGIELHIYVHDSAGIVELWQDGVKIIEQTGIDTLPATNYTRLNIGFVYLWGGNWDGPDYFWLDEVYVQDEQKITGPKIYQYVGSGGLTFGGTAPGLRTFVHIPSGGLTFGGAAPASRTFLHKPRGGIVFGGSADCIWPQKPKRPRAVVRVKKLSAALEMKTLETSLQTKQPQARLEVH